MKGYEKRLHERWESRAERSPQPKKDPRIRLIIEREGGNLAVYGSKSLLSDSFRVNRGSKVIFYFRLLRGFLDYRVAWERRMVNPDSAVLIEPPLGPDDDWDARVTLQPGTVVCTFVPTREIIAWWGPDETEEGLSSGLKSVVEGLLLVVQCPRCRAITGGDLCIECITESGLTIVEDLSDDVTLS